MGKFRLSSLPIVIRGEMQLRCDADQRPSRPNGFAGDMYNNPPRLQSFSACLHNAMMTH